MANRPWSARPTLEILAPDDVHVWWARLGEGPGLVGDGGDLLDAEERRRQARLRQAADRDLYGLAHGLLRLALSRYAAIAPQDWRFVAGPYGKPALRPDFAATAGLAFSLSHGGSIATVAVGRARRIGIDVEPLDRAIDPDELARLVLAPGEALALSKLSGDAKRQTFITLWTLKEAYVKGLGLGLSHPLTACAFVVEPTGDVCADLGPDQGRWAFKHVLAEGRDAVSIAVDGSAGPCRITIRGAWA